MNLTEFFNSLNQIDQKYNKYATYSLTFGNPYRLATSYDAFKYDNFEPYLKNWIAAQGKCIVMPNIVDNTVVGLVFRSLQSKQFRYHNEAKYIPYGAGVNSKPFYKPWIIVESALDSDFIRQFYPYVIATNGTAVSNNTMKFITGTSSTVFVGFDNDKAGDDSFKHLRMKYSGASKDFHVHRLKPPMNYDGKSLKDYGEVLDLLHAGKLSEYDDFCDNIKYSVQFIQ